jgi:hypothetical protein
LLQRLQPPAEVAAAMGVVGMEVDMAAAMEVAMVADTEVDMASVAAAAVGAAATPISPADTIAADTFAMAFVVRQQDEPQAAAGIGFLVGDRVGGKLPVCHIESGQALRNEACPVAKPMHVDAAAVRFSLRDHHARKLVAIFRNLRESRPDCG